MLEIKRTDSLDKDFIFLVHLLDGELAERDGGDHAFYSQFNKIDRIKHAILAYEESMPVGCGAIKAFDEGVMEVKRMYTRQGYRGTGIAGKVLNELEKWAAELGCKKCVLETGKKQPEAIRLYLKSGYKRISNYGPYANVENSVCFEKALVNSQAASVSNRSTE